MFVGHLGVGFGAKAAAPRTSLGSLFLAAQFIDLLWPTLLLLGLERVEIVPGITRVTPLDFTHYPISHSLLAVCCWAVLVGAVYFVAARSTRGAVVCGVLVFSHWLLDLVAHRPDLPLTPGGSVRVGLGLWRSVGATLLVELSILAVGIWLYVRTTRAKNRRGSVGLWTLVALLLVVYLGNVFGPPPPSASALAWVGQTQWLVVAWAYWLDRHREPRTPALPTLSGVGPPGAVR